MVEYVMRKSIKKSVVRIAPTHIDLAIRRINGMVEIGRTISILDIGGGSGEYWVQNEQLRRLLENQNIKVTIFDALIPKSSQNPLFAYVQGEAPDGLKRFEDASFDLVVAFDVIEHMSIDNGYLLLYAMERICRYKAMIFTPNGFVYQKPESGNPHNAHISGWKTKTFKSFGWGNIRGHSGLRGFFGIYGWPKFDSKIKFIHNLVILGLLISQVLIFRAPRFSYAISALYEKKEHATVELSRINLAQ